MKPPDPAPSAAEIAAIERALAEWFEPRPATPAPVPSRWRDSGRDYDD